MHRCNGPRAGTSWTPRAGSSGDAAITGHYQSKVLAAKTGASDVLGRRDGLAARVQLSASATDFPGHSLPPIFVSSFRLRGLRTAAVSAGVYVQLPAQPSAALAGLFRLTSCLEII